MPEGYTFDTVKDFLGKEIGVSPWLEITQERINDFADATDDHQWIHVDIDKAKAGPFKAPIAHGFLTLSLLVPLAAQGGFQPKGVGMGVNYGLNKLRFLNPVKVGSKIRARATLKNVEEKGPGQLLLTNEYTVDIEGEEKPALIAEWLGMVFKAQ